MTFDEYLEKALVVPFKVGGRDYTGWDCWGLVYCFFRDVRNDPIKSYADEYDKSLEYGEIADLIVREKPEWRSVEGRPEFGDVGLYRVGRHNSHVALVLPRARMLHCEGRFGTFSERLDNLMWNARNVGYYRRA